MTTGPVTETVMKREDLLNRLDRMIAGTTVMPFTTSMYLEVMQSCADYLRGHAQTPAEPLGWLHEITEPMRGYTKLYSSSPDNPWSHWLEDHRAKCVYKATPLYAALSDTSAAETCSCVGAVIGSHDSSCPYADTSTLRHGACQVCGEPADLTCGPSRFGDKTWACKDCWEPDSSRICEAGK